MAASKAANAAKPKMQITSKPSTKRKQPEAAANRGGAASTSGAAADDELSGILYIGHLPHGFYEKEMKGFFGQFGIVKNVRLSRSKKSAKSKGYAFLEFKQPEVAPIAASAMDGYIMFSQKLSVRVMKQSEVHTELWKGANQKFKVKQWREMEAERHNKDRTAEQSQARVARAVKRDKERQKAIAAAGIDYSYDGLEGALPRKATRTVFSDA